MRRCQRYQQVLLRDRPPLVTAAALRSSHLIVCGYGSAAHYLHLRTRPPLLLMASCATPALTRWRASLPVYFQLK